MYRDSKFLRPIALTRYFETFPLLLNIFLSDNLSNDISENNGVNSKQKEVRNGSTNTITQSVN
ncbi:hypothetical protein OKIT_0414 [Oenococcus kitaharae DSM 17330]|uniref:Uncharacterized protein n=1 Tax=Oenococcus kitaharae DSM 17330 TaxID=1045004 RepID=G9WEX5_9LACO|nr:hypothetical protein OKIT_0414 [Oenococcus kitaharae DSM 17330]OEY84746.1 hypothetical protein NT95_01370 [Oenococcus kitaharae]OEY85029.1 hypothetical protein NT96_02940 [Oenococcus kitaharae]OEY85820.1 hypothetical protein NV75_03245 [Oenococcus kitaharae]